VKQLILFPLRLLGLICVIALMVGGPSMWVIPDVAARHGVDMSLVVLRVLDDESPSRPLRRLGYEESIQSQLLDLRPGNGAKSTASRTSPKPEDEVVSVSAKSATEGQAYTIRYASGKTQTLTATTPHTTVPANELAAARAAVSRFYSPQSKDWPKVLAWGESLFVTSWVTKYDPAKAPRERFPGPISGSEDEQVWCVWQVLHGGGVPEEDLARLPDLFVETFPDKADQEAALKWASTLYDRLSWYHTARQPYYAVSRGSQAGHEGILNVYHSFQTVLPPKNPWTHLWLLHQYVGLSPAARQAARLRWLKCFPSSREQEVLDLGAKLVEERRGKGESLPNVPDVLPALCVVERLTGTDHDGQAAQEAVSSLPNLKLLGTALAFAYPNDDLFYILAAGNHLEFYPSVRQDPDAPAAYYLAVALYALTIVSLASLGVQTVVGWVGGWLTRRTGNRHLWDKSQNSRGEGSWWLSILSILLFSSVSFLMASWSLPDTVLVQIGSPEELFFGALLATTMGGFLISACRKVLAVFLITCGVDVEETWADEILGILFGGFILYHFGNDLLAIALFALSDLAPGLVLVGLQRLRNRRQQKAHSAAFGDVKPAARGNAPFLRIS
jgi:hypothetical protein